MGRSYHRHVGRSSPDIDGLTVKSHRTQSLYLLSHQQHNSRNALTIFGRLVKQRLANSALCTLAGTFLQRLRTCLQSRWQQQQQQQQQYTPRTWFASESQSEPEGVCHDDISGLVINDKNPGMPQSPGGDAHQSFPSLNFNANANSGTRPDKKRSRSQPRRSGATAAAERKGPQHKRRDKIKCNSHRAGAACQRSKKVSYLRKKCLASRTEEKCMQTQVPSEVEQILTVSTCDRSSNQHEECLIRGTSGTGTSALAELSGPDNIKIISLSEVVPVDGNEDTIAQDKPNKRKRRKRLKSKAVIHSFELDSKKELVIERNERKLHIRQKKQKEIPKGYDSWKSVIVLHPRGLQSSVSCHTNTDNVRDWPTLGDQARPKSVIKEAATEIVRRKYIGSGVRNTGQFLLADVMGVTASLPAETFKETASLGWTCQQQCRSTSDRRTWASVAAQSLADSTPMANQHGETDAYPHLHTSETIGDIPVCASHSFVSLSKTRKSKQKTKMSYPGKHAVGDRSKIKEKLTLGKFLAACEETTQRLKTMRCDKMMANRLGQKDQTAKVGMHQETRKHRKAQSSEKTEDNVKLSTSGLTRGPQTWEMNETCRPQAHTTTPGNLLSNQGMSDHDVQPEMPISSTESLNGAEILAVDNADVSVEVHAGTGTHEHQLSDNPVASRDQQVAADASSSSPGNLDIKHETTNPVDTESVSPKKVSLKYRALMRRDECHSDVKTLAEIHTRNKKCNNRHDSKVAARERQRQQRQNRQTSQHNAVRFHTTTGAEGRVSPARCSRRQFSYWLRSTPARRAFAVADVLRDLQSQQRASQVGEVPGDISEAGQRPAKLEPYRRSERLRARAEMIRSPSSGP